MGKPATGVSRTESERVMELVLNEPTIPKEIIEDWEKRTGLKWDGTRWKAMQDILLFSNEGNEYLRHLYWYMNLHLSFHTPF